MVGVQGQGRGRAGVAMRRYVAPVVAMMVVAFVAPFSAGAQAPVGAGMLGHATPPPSASRAPAKLYGVKTAEEQSQLAAYMLRMKAEQHRLIAQVQEGVIDPPDARERFRAWRAQHPSPTPLPQSGAAPKFGPPAPSPPRTGTWKIGDE